MYTHSTTRSQSNQCLCRCNKHCQCTKAISATTAAAAPAAASEHQYLWPHVQGPLHVHIKLVNAPPCGNAEAAQQLPLVIQHLPPLDVNLNGLALPSGRHARLLQHRCHHKQSMKQQGSANKQQGSKEESETTNKQALPKMTFSNCQLPYSGTRSPSTRSSCKVHQETLYMWQQYRSNQQVGPAAARTSH